MIKTQKTYEKLGAVLVQGAKWCGKTTTSVHHAKSVLYMDAPNQKAQNLALAQTNIKRLLEGETPRVIGQYAYRREDGVFVVPIGCLKP